MAGYTAQHTAESDPSIFKGYSASMTVTTLSSIIDHCGTVWGLPHPPNLLGGVEGRGSAEHCPPSSPRLLKAYCLPPLDFDTVNIGLYYTLGAAEQSDWSICTT